MDHHLRLWKQVASERPQSIDENLGTTADLKKQLTN